MVEAVHDDFVTEIEVCIPYSDLGHIIRSKHSQLMDRL